MSFKSCILYFCGCCFGRQQNKLPLHENAFPVSKEPLVSYSRMNYSYSIMERYPSSE